MTDYDGLRDAVERLIENLSGETSGARSILAQYIEVERTLLRGYQEQLSRFDVDAYSDTFQGATKVAMRTYMDALKFQRQSQEQLIDMQSSFADAYLDFQQEVLSHLHRDNGGDKPASENRQAGAGEESNGGD